LIRFLLSAFIAAAAMLSAQVPTVSLQPNRATASPRTVSRTTISVPTLGFFTAPNGAGLIPIHGLASTATLGAIMPLPEGADSVYLPPREHYALVSEDAAQKIAIWHLAHRHAANGEDALDVVPGALAHPDLVAFSPKGSSAALYYGSSSRLQIVRNLPGRAAVASDVSTSGLGPLSAVVVSDDGAVVIARDSIGRFQLSSNGQSWQVLPWTYAPLAWSFVSNSHDLILSDSQQKNIYLLRQVDNSTNPTTLGKDLEADRLVVTSDGQTVAALDTNQNRLWTIDLTSLTVTAVPLSRTADALTLLRDGHTLLLSKSPASGLYLLKATQDPRAQ